MAKFKLLRYQKAQSGNHKYSLETCKIIKVFSWSLAYLTAFLAIPFLFF
jgi:hypothetical protein